MSTLKRLTQSTVALALSLSAAAAFADSPPAYDNSCKKPEYPRASLVNEEAGTVTLAFTVDATGKVTDSKIVKSSGFKNLDKAAQKDMSACKFKPAIKGGAPAEGTVQIDYTWKLD